MPAETTRRSLLGVAVAALAGCGGERTATSAPEESPVDDGTPNTDCPPALVVSEADPEGIAPESAVDDGALSAAKQATFDRARNDSVEEFAYDWRDIEAVEHEGTYCRMSVVVC